MCIIDVFVALYNYKFEFKVVLNFNSDLDELLKKWRKTKITCKKNSWLYTVPMQACMTQIRLH